MQQEQQRGGTLVAGVFAMGPSGMPPTGPLECQGRIGSPMRGSVRLLYPGHLGAALTIPTANPWRSTKSLGRRLAPRAMIPDPGLLGVSRTPRPTAWVEFPVSVTLMDATVRHRCPSIPVIGLCSDAPGQLSAAKETVPAPALRWRGYSAPHEDRWCLRAHLWTGCHRSVQQTAPAATKSRGGCGHTIFGRRRSRCDTRAR